MRLIGTVLLICMLGLASCDSTDSMEEKREIEIGAVLPLTGTLTRTGSEMRQALEMARDLANEAEMLPGHTIKLMIEDDGSTVDGAEAAFRGLMEDGRIAAILGPYTSSATARIIPLIDEAGVVTVGPSSAAQGLSAMSSYLFRTTLNVNYLVPEGVRATHERLGYQSVALITNDSDTFSKSARDRIKEEVGKLSGVTIVIEEIFTRTPGSGSPDISNQLRAIMSATPRPDAIFFSGLSPDRQNVVQTARSVGIADIPLMTTLMSVDDIRQINAEMPGAAEGVISFTVWASVSTHPASVEFVKGYEERYQVTPGDFAARAYAAADVLFQAMAEALPDRRADAIRDTLASLEDIDTIYGSLSFDEDGDAVYSPSVVQAKGDEFVLFE
ncbi:MAG: ABC transporter substrate-binding protein [Bacteroidota bacterium]|nr:ABC transporter substrate-binding protein [Bacteroidota bacterium]MDE2955952.1 ABC transporter substrate-binding protein [Bacteroidota bacterium]